MLCSTKYYDLEFKLQFNLIQVMRKSSSKNPSEKSMKKLHKQSNVNYESLSHIKNCNKSQIFDYKSDKFIEKINNINSLFTSAYNTFFVSNHVNIHEPI